MNRITNAERNRIYQRASELAWTDDVEPIISKIAAEFGISNKRARRALARAMSSKRTSGTAPDTSLHLGPDRREWLKSFGGIQPTICQLVDAAMHSPTPSE